ncbi:MAG: GNAT family N-acetyltransferase [Bdellovibrionales bacterium]|nr:GNAT family N-acetyltransferase [Bdellovibrionales bacterium]
MKPQAVLLSKSEQSAATDLFVRAYGSDPSVDQLFGAGTPAALRERCMRAYFYELLGLGLKYGRIYGAYQDGHLATASIIYPPGAYPYSRWAGLAAIVRISAKLLFLGGGVRRLARLWGMVLTLEDRQPPAPHFYGEIGCVDPNFQKQGVAAAVLNHILAECDAQQVGFYSETSNPINVSIWKKFGMELVGEKRAAGVTYWALWRAPRPLLRSAAPAISAQFAREEASNATL